MVLDELFGAFFSGKSQTLYATLETRSTLPPVANVHHALLNNSDPFSFIIERQLEDENQNDSSKENQNQNQSIVFTNDDVLIKALPHLQQLQRSTVINVWLDNYQNVLGLKDLGFITLVSASEETFIGALLLSYLISNKVSKPILHFIDYNAIDLNNLDLQIELDSFGEFNVDGVETNTESDLELIEAALEYINSKGIEYGFFSAFSELGNLKDDFAIINFSPYFNSISENSVPVININILNPLNVTKLIEWLPKEINSIAILEQGSSQRLTSFSPLLLEFFQQPNLLFDANISKIASSSVGLVHGPKEFVKIVDSLRDNLKSPNPKQNLFFGKPIKCDPISKVKLDEISKVSRLEASYITILEQLFGENLTLLNQFDQDNIDASNPEYGFGSYLFYSEQQKKLENLIHQSIETPELFNTPDVTELIELLSKWLINFRESQSFSQDQVDSFNKSSLKILELLQNDDSEVASSLSKFHKYLFLKSSWIIGSDSWAYDLGSSGVHNVLSSNENVNVLIIDNETFESKSTATKQSSAQRKKDIGLYAMNYGNAFVGSVAIYYSYTQVLTTLIEAAKFNGPSIILAYLPIKNENDTPLEILTNTKKSVDIGYIPLYRYNPTLKEENIFKLYSTVIKENLQKFLDRENKLTLLSSRNPQFARNLNQTFNSQIKAKQNQNAKKAYDQLLEGLSGPPLSIYFASDGGNAENVAKKLGKRAKQRGLKSTVLSMDDIVIEDLPTEENIVFITSTSGQGEFPQNGKNFWDSIKNSGDLDLEFSKISVFGLGDSQYWPRAQDKHYYNKPAVDLFNRLLFLNAKELVSIGLGDDQDADGFQTGYSEWEPKIWKALGVDDIKTADEPPPITNEDIKIASDYLRGTIAEGLKDESTGAIASSDQQLTKFHGIYMQDDRDLRDARKAAGLEPFYIFMARVRLPGGLTSPDQWLVLDKLADERGNGTIKLTTRATYQLHGIVKHNLKHSIRAMNSVLMDTLGACGDVNRNVMISALPSNAKIHSDVGKVAAKISEHLLPQTTAYHEIWLKGDDPDDDDSHWPEVFEKRKDGPKKVKTLVAGNALLDNEPFYGATYLPRKYKINITVPPYNDVDVWSSDVGLITIIENNEVVGFNVLVGGGMGSTHNNKKTYPRAGSSFGFVSRDQIHLVCEKIMLVQRDHGNRKDRKNARLKYTIDNLGIDVYKSKVEELWGSKFEPERPYEIKDNIDHFGWVTDELGEHHFTCFIENGRVENTPELPQKKGLTKIAQYFKSRGSNSHGTFRLTGNQHLLVSQVSDEELPTIKQLLAEYKLDNTDFSALRLSSAACVAFPTCGLAMAESERYLPVLIRKIEDALEEYGLRHDSVVMRMTGCPNGCARPWLAEIALVGKAYGVYNLMLGGGYYGQRLNKIYRQSIKEEEVLNILKPLFKRWALERSDNEHFGDFLIRAGVIKPTLEGRYFHDDIPEDA